MFPNLNTVPLEPALAPTWRCQYLGVPPLPERINRPASCLPASGSLYWFALLLSNPDYQSMILF